MQKIFFIFVVFGLVPFSVAKSNHHEDFSCDEQKYCKEMRSCAEAKYHLNVCAEGRLDRDKDGIPCENVCRR